MTHLHDAHGLGIRVPLAEIGTRSAPDPPPNPAPFRRPPVHYRSGLSVGADHRQAASRAWRDRKLDHAAANSGRPAACHRHAPPQRWQDPARAEGDADRVSIASARSGSKRRRRSAADHEITVATVAQPCDVIVGGNVGIHDHQGLPRRLERRQHPSERGAFGDIPREHHLAIRASCARLGQGSRRADRPQDRRRYPVGGSISVNCKVGNTLHLVQQRPMIFSSGPTPRFLCPRTFDAGSAFGDSSRMPAAIPRIWNCL